MSFLVKLPLELFGEVISSWLSGKEAGSLDTATCCNTQKLREEVLSAYQLYFPPMKYFYSSSECYLHYLYLRKVQVRNLTISNEDWYSKSRTTVLLFDISFAKVDSLAIADSSNVSELSLLKVINACTVLRHLE